MSVKDQTVIDYDPPPQEQSDSITLVEGDVVSRSGGKTAPELLDATPLIDYSKFSPQQKFKPIENNTSSPLKFRTDYGTYTLPPYQSVTIRGQSLTFKHIA